MLSRVHPALRGPVRSATVSGAVYAVALAVLVAGGADGPAAWDELWRVAAGPVALLVAQVVAVAGLLHLFVALRNLARRIARDDEPDPDVARPFGLLIVPLSATLTSTLVVVAAARSWIGYPGLLLWLVLVPAAAFVALRSPGWATDRPTSLGVRARAQERTVGRLRGASIATAVTGGVFFFVSGSLVAGALLPLAFLTRVPAGPPALAASTLPEPLAEPGGGGGGGDDTRGSGEHDTHLALRAGEAIHLLMFAGSARPPDPLERPPVRRLPPLWDGAAAPPLPLAPETWARDLYAWIEAGHGTEEELDFLAWMADHPANEAFDALAGAPTADVAGARWRPLDGHRLTSFELPVPRSVELWRSVRGRIAGAFHVAGTGDTGEARRRLSTVVDLGRLMARDGPLVTDARVGVLIAREGGTALNALAGAPANDALSLPGPATPRDRRPRPSTRLEWLRAHTALVDDSAIPRGLRWEAFTLARTFTPCASIRATLLGPSPTPGTPEAILGAPEVSTPQDRALADLLGHGLLGTRTGTQGWGWLPRILGLALSDRPAVSHCAPLAATLFQSG